MRKLYLVHPVGRSMLRTFSWIDGRQEWRREPGGDFVLTVGDEEYVLPPTSVAHESRPTEKARAKKAS